MGRRAHLILAWLAGPAAALILVCGFGLWRLMQGPIGSEADAKVSANPLSAFAPGFLCRLFQPNFGMPPPIQQSLGVQ